MKVFLSWSGDLSHKIAITFRDWLPSVIQSLIPYVSSEDIDKGARWSTDIARELENSNFGILCVTRDNINAPWLNFEAGALSKTINKAHVIPFIFGIKRSEVDGPILQFQSTIFEKEDIKKLINTLNKANDSEMLLDDRLDKSFDVWYPTLETELNKLSSCDVKVEINSENLETVSESTILEEILDLSRNNQKLLRNPSDIFTKDMDEIKNLLVKLDKNVYRQRDVQFTRNRNRFPPILFEEILHMPMVSEEKGTLVQFQMVLSFLKNDYPWLYDVGIDLVKILRSTYDKSEKKESINYFMDLLEFTFEHPIMVEIYGDNNEWRILRKELQRFFMYIFNNYWEYSPLAPQGAIYPTISPFHI